MSCEVEKGLDLDLGTKLGSYENGCFAATCKGLVEERRGVYVTKEDILETLQENPNTNPCIFSKLDEFCNAWVTEDKRGQRISPELARIIFPEGLGVGQDHPEFTFVKEFDHGDPTNQDIEKIREVLKSTPEDEILFKCVATISHMGLALIAKKPYGDKEGHFYNHRKLIASFLNDERNSYSSRFWAEGAYNAGEGEIGLMINDIPVQNFFPTWTNNNPNISEIHKIFPVFIQYSPFGYRIIIKDGIEEEIKVMD